MKKLTKKERAEKYLNDLANTENFDVEQLDKMTVYDLIETPELKGIGKTTLSVALKSLKKTHGLKKEGETELEDDKNKVERYLIELVNTENFTLQDLMDLSVYDLLGNAELEGIEKATLNNIINSFKRKRVEARNEEDRAVEIKTDITDMNGEDNENPALEENASDLASETDDYDVELFENALINAIEEESEEQKKERKEKKKKGKKEKNERKEKNEKKKDKYELKLSKDDLSILKEVINEYKKDGSKLITKKERRESSELKRALKHFGIDYKKILNQYRKISEG